jgi:hypothetical protein
MIIIAVLNGIAREFLYKKYMTELAAHQWSTIILIFLLGYYIMVITGMYPLKRITAVYIGILWAAMTLLFESGLAFYAGKGWGEILADYDISKGRIWALIPAWICIAPYLLLRLNQNIYGTSSPLTNSS